MRKTRYYAAGWAAMLWALLSLTVAAQDGVWGVTRAKLASTTGYSVTCDYQGPEGRYQFRYVVQGDGDKILTEVLPGSSRGAGSMVLYDPASDPDNVKLKTSMLSLRRSLQARDIKDSPLHQSLFKQMLDQLIEPGPREVQKRGENTLLVFGEKGAIQDILLVDRQGNPLSASRLEKGEEVRRMDFRDLTWGTTAINWPDSDKN